MLVILLTFFLFATGIFVNKQLLFVLPPTLLVGIRMFASGIILALFSYKQRNSLKNLYADRFSLLLIALLTVLFPALLKAYALSKLSAGQTALLSSVDPFVTAFYAYIIWHEKMSPTKIIGILFGCIGTWITITIPYHDVLCMQTILPQLAVLASVSFGRLGWIMVRMLLKKDLYSGPQLNSVIMTLCGSIALVMSLFIDNYEAIAIPSVGRFVFLLIFTVLVGNVGGYTLYAHIIKHYNITLISLAGFSVPLFVSLYDLIFTGRSLTLNFIYAVALLFSGLLIFYSDELKKKKMFAVK